MAEKVNARQVGEIYTFANTEKRLEGDILVRFNVGKREMVPRSVPIIGKKLPKLDKSEMLGKLNGRGNMEKICIGLFWKELSQKGYHIIDIHAFDLGGRYTIVVMLSPVQTNFKNDVAKRRLIPYIFEDAWQFATLDRNKGKPWSLTLSCRMGGCANSPKVGLFSLFSDIDDLGEEVVVESV